MDMRIKFYSFYGVIAAILGITSSNAAQSNTPFSQHGVIQNVQNYSSNPFWNPNSPYNQRMPTAVYSQGTDVKTAECQNLAAGLIAQQCSMRNNCANTQLSDIRPALMIAMSQMPGGNYSTACVGYLDTAFAEYRKTHTAITPGMPTAFPTATVPNPNMASAKSVTTTLQQNNMPQWAGDMISRQAELQALQQQTGNGPAKITATEFPTTYADLSFTERMANEKAGYEPFKDKSAYVQIELESEEEYLDRKIRIAQLRRKYCEEKYGPNTKILREDLAALQKCRAEKKPISECKLQGSY